jgi:hypothetical protein
VSEQPNQDDAKPQGRGFILGAIVFFLVIISPLSAFYYAWELFQIFGIGSVTFGQSVYHLISFGLTLYVVYLAILTGKKLQKDSPDAHALVCNLFLRIILIEVFGEIGTALIAVPVFNVYNTSDLFVITLFRVIKDLLVFGLMLLYVKKSKHVRKLFNLPDNTTT